MGDTGGLLGGSAKGAAKGKKAVPFWVAVGQRPVKPELGSAHITPPLLLHDCVLWLQATAPNTVPLLPGHESTSRPSSCSPVTCA